MGYLTQEGIENLPKYKYVGGDNSPVYKYFMSPIADKLLIWFVPEWMAPNVITTFRYDLGSPYAW